MWYADFISKVHVSDIFHAVHKKIVELSSKMRNRIPKPFMAIHLRMGRMLTLYIPGVVDSPHVYKQVGSLVIECIFHRIDVVLKSLSIRSILVLDDFEQMHVPEAMAYLKYNIQSEITHQLYRLQKNGTNILYSVGT